MGLSSNVTVALMDNNELNTLKLIDTDWFMADVHVVKREIEGVGESVKKISEQGQGVGGVRISLFIILYLFLFDFYTADFFVRF